ncbi:PLP-dependent aminotransferase family protein [Nocardiopsis sp. N85]|uniref:aminotransferase-like domain-containing protein n=1 Tax=Nocardiopsis sp. N85 TaxID=3029400 RepID=UPI00237F79F8|nr:PLP-dependent aminotransferase family protein [Nocardiopsis sp. N85]MDE3723689.1 PLP-dependent aminotransferase family protein [Nocardiopsis sp. N85]
MNKGSSDRDLADFLRREFERYAPGERLPASRSLVERHGVGPGTLSRAMARLVAEGLVVTRPGAGSFRAGEPVRRLARDTSWQEVALDAVPEAGGIPRSVDDSGLTATFAPAPPGVISLHAGYPHASLRPDRELSAAVTRAARRPGVWGSPPWEGVTELRDWFAREIDGASLDASHVLVTGGGQSALATALRALAPPGAPVLVESPTYPGLLAVARALGMRLVPVPVDEDGLRVELLVEAFAGTGARVLVCQPLFHNPTGAVLAPERRAGVLRAAREAGAFVVEDDFARRLAHTDAPPSPPPLIADDRHGTVVHVHSLTKATSPGLRVGALAARGPVLRRLRAVQVVDSLFVPRVLQETVLELVGSPAWGRHLRALSEGLTRRRTAVAAALLERAPLVEPVLRPGGYQVWVRLPDGTDEDAVAGTALRAGVKVAAGRPFFPGEPPAPYLRLAFADTSGPEEAAEGVRRLAGALAGL